MNIRLANINGVYHTRESWLALFEAHAKTMTKADVIREIATQQPDATVESIARQARSSKTYAYVIGNNVRKVVAR